MSLKRNSIRYGVAAAALAILVISGITYLTGLPIVQNNGSVQGPTSLLVIQLTDPPQVPSGTTSLNMTYSSLSLLVGEPTGVDSQMTTKSITLTPSGGTATLDLLKLQNVSQTIASASLPDGSSVYTATFTVTKLSIDVGGTISTVSLATGTTFTVTLSNVPVLHGTNVALLRLDPVVVTTSTGYSLIPSSVGVLRQSEGQGEDQIGFHHKLTGEDWKDIDNARGSTSANLLSLTVSGTTTTVVVQVTNTGSGPMNLNAIGLGGSFTVSGLCGGTTTTTTSTQSGDSDNHGHNQCGPWDHPMEVVFVPVVPSTTTTTSTSTTTSSTCTALTMQLLNGRFWYDHDNGLTLAPGTSVNLPFSGTLTFGDSSITLVPSTASGQTYQVHIIASNGANLKLDCTLPLGTGSCTVDQDSG